MAYTSTIGAGYNFAAAILEDNSISVCRMRNDAEEFIIPHNLPPVKEIYCTDITLIALCYDNSLYGFGRLFVNANVGPYLGKVKKHLGGNWADCVGMYILCENDTICRLSGHLNDNVYLPTNISPQDVEQIDVADFAVALLNDGSIHSWEIKPNSIKWNVPDNLPPAQQIICGGERDVLVLFQDGTIRHWDTQKGGDISGTERKIPFLPPIKQITYRGVQVFALCKNGTVFVWQYEDDFDDNWFVETVRVCPLLMPAVQIASALDDAVFLCEDGSLHFWSDRYKKSEQVDLPQKVKIPERRDDESVYVLK
jgi:hypothetical protein